jgi:hypothetical protein
MYRFTTAFVICVALLGPGTAIAIAQSRSDSAEVARLIVSRALQDARRQASDIQYLSYVPESLKDRLGHSEPDTTGIRLVGLAADSQLVQHAGSPTCPWYVGGSPNPTLQLVVRKLRISATAVSAEVILGCSPGLTGRRGFMWSFTYTLDRTREGWKISEVREDWIT